MPGFKRALTRAQVIVIAIVVALVATGVAYYTALLAPQPQQRLPPGAKPIVFVHGGSGSAQQFESQAMRFTSNGYPPSYIWVFEYDSSHAIETLDQVLNRLDTFVEEVLNSTRADKVDLVGHSYGGLIVLMYLQRPEAREKVARCVVIDSLVALMRGYTKAPEGVKTLVIWGRARDPRYPQLIEGAVNVHFSEKNHVEVCTSAEAFVEMYKFFTGEEPATKDIVPEHEVWIAGRVVIFPINVFKEYPEGRPATLEIWEVDPTTGSKALDLESSSVESETWRTPRPSSKSPSSVLLRPSSSTTFEPFVLIMIGYSYLFAMSKTLSLTLINSSWGGKGSTSVDSLNGMGLSPFL